MFAKEYFTYVRKRQAFPQEMSSPQYDSMLIGHAWKPDPHTGTHLHTETRIRTRGYTDQNAESPTLGIRLALV